MFLPFFGFAGKSKYNSVEGASNRTGFELTIKKENGFNLCFKTKNFRNIYIEESDAKSKLDLLWILASCLMALSFPMFNIFDLVISSESLPIHYQLFYGSLQGAFFFFIFIVINYIKKIIRALIQAHPDKELREWHACEHKSAALLEAGLEPTIENLNKCPVFTILCNTITYGLILEFVIGIMAVYILNYFDILSLEAIFSIGTITALELFFLALSQIYYRHFIGFLSFLLAFPLYAFPLLVQKICLKTPSKEKLSQTAADLQEFLLKPALF